MHCFFRAFVCTLALLPSIPAGAQSVAQGPAATAGSISLPVVVRDNKGALVTTLKPSDVSLSVDNQPLKLSGFSIQSGQPFLLGLLVQTTHGMEGARADVKAAAAKFIDQMLLGSNQGGTKPSEAFLIHFDRDVELLSDFTAKPADIHRELDTLGPTQITRHDRAPGPDDEGGQVSTGANVGGFSGTRTSNTLYDAIFLAADELMKTRDGRKALIIFSDGVDRGSKENLTDAIEAADRANLTLYTIFFRGEEARQGFNGLPGQNNGHHGGIGFPGGWPGGGGSHPGGSNEPKPAIDGKKIMQQLADRTGGSYFEVKKKDSLSEAFAGIATELNAQYLLTFTPEKPDPDGGYHKITLKTSDTSLKLQTREGYYAPTQ